MKKKYIYQILILKNYLERIAGPHYPTELVKKIIVADYHNLIIKYGESFAISISDVIYILNYNMEDEADTEKVKKFIKSNDIIAGDSGGYGCHVITKFGTCYTWGLNDEGQLGLGHTDDCFCPEKLPLLNVKSINTGDYHAFALTKTNTCYVWGYNFHGQLGLGDNVNRNRPTKFTFFSDNKIVSVACGLLFTIALVEINSEMKCFAWGDNTFGQLCLENIVKKNIPQEIKIPDKIMTITCGHSHSIILITNHELYGWGRNICGQLGLGDFNDRNSPTKLKLNDIISVSCREHSTLALVKSGGLYSWGDNTYGQLGLGGIINISNPTKINLSEKIISVKCDYGQVVAITNQNNIYLWGCFAYDSEEMKDIDFTTPRKLDF
jgi:alpha-tubulin suppressor-like RCC1 family protein